MIWGKRKFVLDTGLQSDGQNIEYADKVKFLGVQIDRKLSWQDHISDTCKRLAKSVGTRTLYVYIGSLVGIIAKARMYLCRKTMITLFYTFCYSYLTYCNIVWVSTYTSPLDCLIVLQKRIIMVVDHTQLLYFKQEFSCISMLIAIFQIFSMKSSLSIVIFICIIFLDTTLHLPNFDML